MTFHKDRSSLTAIAFDVGEMTMMRSRNYLILPLLAAFASAQPAQARFLQTDPVGYKDQVNLYAYVGNDPVDNRDPTGLDTEVVLQSYSIDTAPIQGDYGHQYILMRDTETGVTVISRAGPSSPYPGGVSGAITGSPSRGSDGRTVTLVTQMTPAAKSADSSASGTPLGRTVPGSATTLKEPIGAAMATLGKFNQSVDSAGITYQPRGTNSNAYAGTGYSVLTGRAAPTSGSLPGSNVDLRPVINPPPPPPARPYDRCTSHPGSC